MSTKLNYWITVATLANLVFVTLSVWFFPNQRILEVPSTLAWILIVVSIMWLIDQRIDKLMP